MKNQNGALRVLIVEDDQGIRDSIKEFLEIEGYEALAATNGREALDTLTHKPLPSIILLDLMMPAMNGWEFIEAKNSIDAFADIPVIVISAAGKEVDKPKGIQDFMRKPVDLFALFNLIQTYCGAT